MNIVNAASNNHSANMQRLGKLCEADEVHYVDRGKGEDYIIVKKGRRFHIPVHGNQFEGGWLGTVEELIEEAATKTVAKEF